MTPEEQIESRINEVYMECATAVCKERDRGAVLFGCSLIDESLKRLLIAAFATDAPSKRVQQATNMGGFAATFSARLRCAFLLRLIPKNMHDSIEAIRGVRNDVAHETDPFRLSDKIEKICGNIKHVEGDVPRILDTLAKLGQAERIDGMARSLQEQGISLSREQICEYMKSSPDLEDADAVFRLGFYVGSVCGILEMYRAEIERLWQSNPNSPWSQSPG